MLEIEFGSTKSHSLDSSLWKSVWIWRKTEYAMMTMVMMMMMMMMMMMTYLFLHVINIL